jgi:hypothetical protein
MLMWLELEVQPSLTSPEAFDWVLHKGAVPLPGPPAKPDDPKLTFVKSRAVGAPDKDTTGNPLQVIAYQKQLWSLQDVKNKKHIGNFSTYLLTFQPVRIQVISNLFYKPDLPQAIKDKIVRLFDAYDRAKDGEPIAYAAKNMPPDLQPDMFTVLPSYTLEKVGQAATDNTQEQRLRNYIAGHVPGQIIPSGEDLEHYMPSLGLCLQALGTTDLTSVPSPTPDNPHVIETNNPDDPTPIDPILNDDAKGMECHPDKSDREKILVLSAWPEFKIEFHDTRIDIGCGVTIVVTLPVLYTRMSRLVLWAALAHPDYGPLIERQLVDCLIRAALAGVVIGLVTEDFYAAAAAFAAAFYAQYMIYAGQDLQCLVPDLFLLTDNSAWQRR